MIAYGPDGTLYVADCTGHPPTKGGPLDLEHDSLRDVAMWIAASPTRDRPGRDITFLFAADLAVSSRTSQQIRGALGTMPSES
jgi:hypothetical protein